MQPIIRNGQVLNEQTAYVFEKPSVIPIEYAGGGYLIDFYGSVFDLDVPYPMFKRHKDGMYYNRGELMKDWGTLTFKDGPRFGRFIGSVYGSEGCGRHISRSYYLMHTLKDKFNKFVFVQEVATLADSYSIDNIVGMMYYAECSGIPLEKCFVCKGIAVSGLMGRESSLSDVWDEVKDQVPEAPEGGVKQVIRLMTLAGMSKREFADYFGIKPRTVENWCYLPKSDAPDWAVPLMELKLSMDGKI